MELDRMSNLDVLNKLAKWRNVFAAWQLGTRTSADGECRAVKDHREVTILMRAEISALTGLLIKKSVITQPQFEAALVSEAGMTSDNIEDLDTLDDDRCVSCGAEIDHHLGCPDDPDPDYEAEAQLGGTP
jgi:hypothetical protein